MDILVNRLRRLYEEGGLMGSIIDMIIEKGTELDHPFTPKEMSELIYGDSDYQHLIATHQKLKRLVNQGFLEKQKNERVGSQWKVTYKVIV